MTKLLTVTDAATELGVSRRRVLALIQQGRLRADRLGNQFVIKPADLDAIRDRKPGRPPKAKPRGKAKP